MARRRGPYPGVLDPPVVRFVANKLKPTYQAIMMLTPTDAEALYRQLSHLIATTPDLVKEGMQSDFSSDCQRWMARVYAAVKETGELVDAVRLTTHFTQLQDNQLRAWGDKQIRAILHRAWALAEAKAPASAQGSFIPAGAVFDAFAVIGKVFSGAARTLLVVDPYMDEKALTDFLALAPEGVSIRLLADAAHVKASLKPAVKRWIAQHGRARPLEARLAASRTIHDRVIIVDDAQAWILTQSLNAFANRAPGSVEAASTDSNALKLDAYAEFWLHASPL